MSTTTTPAGAAQEPRTTGTSAEAPAVRVGHGELLRAIEKNVQDNSVKVEISGLGTVRLPAADSLAWIGGLVTLAAVGILEWPVAAAIGVGHLLSRQRHLRLLRDFGEALEEA
ncbi:hypothetical protein LWC35_10040 [Pseudonocardia kujensis]|uniref:hypothetical protein n=1 Tax=Pseudonocardia kujensis TaxID=1128675 RepID=UPI001E4CD7D6|nr:hypothetical protein [Pseudonocardia kujensis]MCE0763244.1 hypothetical protein [Pseudonocardia kujensis]